MMLLDASDFDAEKLEILLRAGADLKAGDTEQYGTFWQCAKQKLSSKQLKQARKVEKKYNQEQRKNNK